MRFLLAALLLGATLVPAATIPRPAPELSIAAAGKPVKLSDYKGKVVIVEILSTTCPHCQQSAAMISRILQEYGSRGVQAMGVAINEKPDVPGFIRSNNVTFPIGAGRRETAYQFLEASYMVPFYFPQLVFVDQKGMIRAQYGGTDAFVQNNAEQNVRGMLDKLLAEGGAKPPARATKPRKKAS